MKHDFKEFDTVKTTHDVEDAKIYAGSVGTIVMVYTYPDLAYEVEFCDNLGQTIAQIVLKTEDIIPTQS